MCRRHDFQLHEITAFVIGWSKYRLCVSVWGGRGCWGEGGSPAGVSGMYCGHSRLRGIPTYFKCLLPSELHEEKFPADTSRNNDVVITSKRCHLT